MKMHFTALLSAFTVSAMLVSCSDSSGGSTSSNKVDPTPSATISAETLNGNYTATLTSEEVSKDLSEINSSADASLISKITSQNPMALMSSAFGGGGSLTKKSTTASSVDANGCFTMDTTITQKSEGVTVKTSISTETSAGDAFKICAAQIQQLGENVFTLFDGVVFHVKTVESSEYQILSSDIREQIDLELEGENPTISVDMAGSLNATFLDVEPDFNMYLDFTYKMAMPFNLTNPSEVDPTGITYEGSFSIWFQEGKYKCTYSFANSSAEFNSCDLTHNGEVVGEISKDDSGILVIKDAKGNVIE